VRIGPFFKRREIWVPTWRACVLALALLTGAAILFVVSLPPFLSPNKPINAEVLAIEGWVSEHGLETAVQIAKSGRYKLIVSTGGPIEKGMNISAYETYANLGASRLREFGCPTTNLVAVPAPNVPRDRTYHSALAVKAYLQTNTTYRSIDLLSAGVHSRRSWRLYELACEPEFKVGVIADIDPTFDLKNWWSTSYGVRTVINELIGYLYIKIAFNPE
jgi:hypothetical protein